MLSSGTQRSDEPFRCRVLVIGSGPAGASAASHLSRLGVGDVLVLDRLSGDRHRRYHSICGEAVSDRSLKRAGIATSHVIQRVSGIDIMLRDGRSTHIRASGCIVDREGMLQELLSSSGARVVEGAARSVRRLPEGGFEVDASSGRIVCDAVIGADGAFSVVRRDLFGTRPERSDPIVNTLVPGEPGDALKFYVGGIPGGYSWDFPSSGGRRSVGFPRGHGTVPGSAEHGARFIPVGRVPKASCDGCVLAGDAAGLANPLCYGGIGAALISGRKAAEAVASGNYRGYDDWVNSDRMFDRRFMEVHKKFERWTDGEIEDALGLLEGKAYVLKGIIAMLRRPRYAEVYFACWLGFRIGWRRQFTSNRI